MKDKLFNKRNFIFLGLAVATILVGFYLLSQGQDPEVGPKWNNPLSITVAPILLVIAYVVLIPYAILTGNEKSGD